MTSEDAGRLPAVAQRHILVRTTSPIEAAETTKLNATGRPLSRPVGGSPVERSLVVRRVGRSHLVGRAGCFRRLFGRALADVELTFYDRRGD
ncbi:YdiU family protein [Halorussus salinisoli]|uniref:YdiU family protein n=1 Tax=Halorussus salinisoli TaxID=2558242 RepID=UPI0010C229E9|nr:YdiU family protein [Halorussus salinisoli]